MVPHDSDMRGFISLLKVSKVSRKFLGVHTTSLEKINAFSIETKQNCK